MGKRLHDLANVLAVANQLHEKGDIGADTLKLIVDAADTTIADSESFLRDLRKWAVDLVQMDDSGNQLQMLQMVLNSFLQSPMADERKLRGEALELLQHFKKLLLALDNYDEQKLAFKLINK